MQALELRLTHGYVGTWKHLDKWLYLGRIDEIGTRELPVKEDEEDPDPCDPKRHEIFALVEIDQDSADFHARWTAPGNPDYSVEDGAYEKWVEKQIEQALHDVYSSHGCDHEYDCCGCRSYSAGDIECIARGKKNLYRIVVGSSRNY